MKILKMKTCFYIPYTLVVFCLLLFSCMHAQTLTDASTAREQLIAASQGSASPLFFSMNKFACKAVDISSFSNPNEFFIRNGLPNFFAKARTAEKMTIAYIGGSITQAELGYRLQSAAYIQKMFPQILMEGINAGVSGTGTDLGACRIQEHVIQFNPDLVFIEFAVNGAYTHGMEGMVRQIRKSDPAIDICFIYTIYSGQSKSYAEGSMPENIQALEAISEHYKIPSIHLGMHAAFLEKEGKLIWNGNNLLNDNGLVFSTDGTHPLEEGGNLYAAAIARAFEAMNRAANKIPNALPTVFLRDNWEDAKMLDPESAASFSGGWTKIKTAEDKAFERYEPWFPYIMKADKPGAALHFAFRGTAFGFFDIGGPEVGQLQIEVDGKRVYLADKQLRGTHIMTTSFTAGDPLINRFNAYCNNRYRGQYQVIEVEPGLHSVSITVSPTTSDKHKILGEKNLSDITANPQKYNQTVFYIGKLLLRGELAK